MACYARTRSVLTVQRMSQLLLVPFEVFVSSFGSNTATVSYTAVPCKAETTIGISYTHHKHTSTPEDGTESDAAAPSRVEIQFDNERDEEDITVATIDAQPSVNMEAVGMLMGCQGRDFANVLYMKVGGSIILRGLPGANIIFASDLFALLRDIDSATTSVNDVAASDMITLPSNLLSDTWTTEKLIF